MVHRHFTLYVLLTVVLVVGAVVGWLLLRSEKIPETTQTELPTADVASEKESLPLIREQLLGTSVEGRAITLHSIGTGESEVTIVGGIHGGYEWNSILLAYALLDYFTADPSLVPAGVTLSIIPNLNPDGLFAATGLTGRFSSSDITDQSMHQTGEGRFNANGVDLNRNFDCNWAPESSWRGRSVSAGTAPFSEPEAAAFRDYAIANRPVNVIFLHSQAGEVYGASCTGTVGPGTTALLDTYAKASGYGAVPLFTAYPVTGDAEGWLTSIGIPAITVELKNRIDLDWQENLAATKAVLERSAGYTR